MPDETPTIIDFSTSNTDCSENLILTPENTKSSEEEGKNPKFENQLNEIYSSLTAMKQYITQVTNKVKDLEKTYRKEQRNTEKFKDKRNKGNRQPSGFAKPTTVSDELCNFMNKKKGSLIARTEATQYIIKYIQEKQLQDANNKKKIVPNQSLKNLLKTNEGEEINYFNIQRLINPHFKY